MSQTIWTRNHFGEKEFKWVQKHELCQANFPEWLQSKLFFQHLVLKFKPIKSSVVNHKCNKNRPIWPTMTLYFKLVFRPEEGGKKSPAAKLQIEGHKIFHIEHNVARVPNKTKWTSNRLNQRSKGRSDLPLLHLSMQLNANLPQQYQPGINNIRTSIRRTWTTRKQCWSTWRVFNVMRQSWKDKAS